MNKIRIYIGIAGIMLLFLVTVYVVALYVRRIQPTQPITSQTPMNSVTPRVSINNPYLFVSPSANNKTTKLLDNTGALDELASPEASAASERSDLLLVLPITTDNFKITMDYKNLKYVVTFIDESNLDNMRIFNNWHKRNYSAVGIEEFTFR